MPNQNAGFLKGVWEGLAGGTARTLKKMLIFPNCSGKKCPIQKILNLTGQMPGGATCRTEVKSTQYDNSSPNTDGCAQSVDHRLQVTLMQVQCSADSRPKIENFFLLYFYPMRPIKSENSEAIF